MGASDGISSGVRAALAEVGAAIDASHADPTEQLELLAAPSLGGGEMAAENTRKALDYHRARGAGRPPGARNIATRDMLAFLRSHGFDPAMERFRWAMHSPETLAFELGCTRVEAFDRLEAIWKDLTRYFYAPLAPVDGKGNAVVPNFTLIMGGGRAGEASDLPAWLTDPEVRKTIEHERAEAERNQVLSEAEASVSQSDVSQSG